jgi:alkyldihydroxyacetonephosphate synthase
MMSDSLRYWGWGRADRLPDEAARRALAEQVSFLLGCSVPSSHEPAPLEGPVLPPPRIALPSALAAFSTDAIRTRAHHTYGKGYLDIVRGFAGQYTTPPDQVVVPRTEQEIEAVLDWATGARVAVVPFGGGTSVVGGVEAGLPDGYAGVIALDLQRLDRVLEVDTVSRSARIQAGVLGPALEAQLVPHGLTLRHFPQSFEFSTLGGWIATRAAGHFATLTTRIDDFVESVRMLTPRGPYETRRLPSSGAGPAAERLVLGSEGTLGIVTEAWMRVQALPRWRARASIFFRDFASGAEATRELAQSGLYPANCRLLDPGEALLHSVAADGTSVLLLGFESADHELEAWMSRGLAIAAAHGGRCPGGPRQTAHSAADATDAWRGAFLSAPYLQSALVTLGVMADTFETACTWDRFAGLHAGVVSRVEECLERICGAGMVTCRLTHVYPDGPAPYYTMVAPVRRGAEREVWMEAKRVASDAILAGGGTITHHHAVGRVHRPWYDRERPELFAEALRAAKSALDPAGILNPGVLVGG